MILYKIKVEMFFDGGIKTFLLKDNSEKPNPCLEPESQERYEPKNLKIGRKIRVVCPNDRKWYYEGTIKSWSTKCKDYIVKETCNYFMEKKGDGK